jgi:hypothetical protein
MLESERVHSVPVEARWLFAVVMLLADDVGLFEVNWFKLSRKSGIDQKVCEKLLPLLADADLVRMYQASGKTYGFVPRFGQRLQIKRVRHPIPPAALYADDEDASKKFNDLAAKARLANGGAPLSSAAQRPEPEPEPVSSPKKQSAARKRADGSAARTLGVRELVQLGVEAKHAADWLTARKAKRLPLTQTALDGVVGEAAKAGLPLPQAVKIAAEVGWGGFRADWLKPEHRMSNAPGDWKATRSSIEAKGVEVGVGKWDQAAWENGRGGDAWPVYVARIERALAKRMQPA